MNKVYSIPTLTNQRTAYIDVDPEPVDQDVECLGDRVHLADSVKHDIDGGDEDLPGTVDREEVAEEVEVLPLAALGPVDPLAHVLKVVQLKEQVL